MSQANPGMYSSIGDGFKKINAAEGLKGFTLVSLNARANNSV